MMKKVLFFLTIAIFTLNAILPLSAYAYSYGDPNEEKVAEVYKSMKEKLNENPPNFNDAKSLFETVKEEIDMHMGTEPAETVLKDIEEKDKDQVIKDMQKILVLNIARRLDNVEKDFDNYDTNKKLIAKAFATYEALSPTIQENDQALDKSLRENFNNILSSLGNPGLFGVGKKQADINLFKQNKETVYKELQKQFNLKSLKVGHFSEGQASEQMTQTETKDWTDLSNIKNWIPIIVLVVVIIGIIIFAKRRKK